MFKNAKNSVISLGSIVSILGIGLFGGMAPASAAPGDVVNPITPKTYNYTSEFGGRCLPTFMASANHLGQDMSAKDGTKIKAIADGTVSYVRQASGSSVAGTVTIKHKIDGKTYYSAYVHMWNATEYVKVGSVVKKGQTIAKVGSSGPSTGPHLHVEIWENAFHGSGTAINPTTFMKSQGVDLKADAIAVTTKAKPATCTYYINGATQLKASPNTSAANLSSVAKGTKVTSPNEVSTQSGNFLKVVVNGQTGWISRANITPSYIAPAPVAKPAPTPAVKVVTAKTTANVNFRTGASTAYKVIKTLPKGTTVEVTGKVSANNWKEVKHGGKTGWVSASYLK